MAAGIVPAVLGHRPQPDSWSCQKLQAILAQADGLALDRIKTAATGLKT